MTKKILLLSVSIGAGHVRAAQAIQAAANEDDGVQILHLDALDFVSSAFRKLYSDLYLKMVAKLPAVWGYLYQASHDAAADSLSEKIRRGIERLSTRALRQEILNFNPDVILCTHFLPAEILDRMIRKESISCPVWVQVTDFDLHRMWVHEHMSGYFAANEEVAYRMCAAGVAAENVHVLGIPIMPNFSQPLDRAACAKEFGLNPEKTTVMLMGGGVGLGSLEKVAENLLQLKNSMQLIVLAGRNEETLKKLQAMAKEYPGCLFPQGFTDKVDKLMACSDLVITKPGGLSTSECLAMGKAMILNSPIPGQEERNADYLLEQGVALKACDAITLEYRVKYLLENPDKLNEMCHKAKKLGRPTSAREVLTTLKSALVN
jgi:processive 1,2-diacylglycerol beta-glucosyltransferase